MVEVVLRVGWLSLVLRDSRFAYRLWLWRLQLIPLPLRRTLSWIATTLQVLLLLLGKSLRRLQELLLHVLLLRYQLLDHV